MRSRDQKRILCRHSRLRGRADDAVSHVIFQPTEKCLRTGCCARRSLEFISIKRIKRERLFRPRNQDNVYPLFFYSTERGVHGQQPHANGRRREGNYRNDTLNIIICHSLIMSNNSNAFLIQSEPKHLKTLGKFEFNHTQLYEFFNHSNHSVSLWD